MAAFVQDDHLSESGVSSQNIAFGSNVAAGSMIIVLGGGSSSTLVTAVTDTQSNTYASVVTNADASSGASIWACVNAVGGACTVTITYGTSNNPQTTILEASGLNVTSVASATDVTGSKDNSVVTAHPCSTGDITSSVTSGFAISMGRSSAGMTKSAVESGYTSAVGGSRLAVQYNAFTGGTLTTDGDFTTSANATTACAIAIFKDVVSAGGWGPLLGGSRNRLVVA